MWPYILIAAIVVIIVDIIILIWWKSTTIQTPLFNVLNFVELKRHTNMNIFGMIFIGLLINIMMLPIALFYWIHLACTWHPKKRERI